MISQAFDSQDQLIVAQCLVRVNKTVPAKRGRALFGCSATAGGPQTNKEATGCRLPLLKRGLFGRCSTHLLERLQSCSSKSPLTENIHEVMVQFLYNRLS